MLLDIVLATREQHLRTNFKARYPTAAGRCAVSPCCVIISFRCKMTISRLHTRVQVRIVQGLCASHHRC